ncbi:hypothetical protein BYT27DRAFT_7110147 [Phlegmacium glaucopus]|nr:hypothetical protein BYT27DRAFT_7110147 [Phlegmacium glaucopus]
MGSTAITLLILLSSPLAHALDFSLLQVWRRSSNTTKTIPSAGYYNPLSNGGGLLALASGTFPPGQGEPMNAIISGNSDARVLVDAEINGGLRNFFLSFGFSAECLGQHSGAPQLANLGDGNGPVNETGEIRWNYGDAQLGACKETIQGGDHFRYWIQNGPQGDSGAIFMATSYEMPLDQGHDIIINGYNLGRDWLIGNITQSPIPTQNLTNTSTFTGTTSWNNYTYQSQISYVSGLLQSTNIGINHNTSVSVNGVNAVDGLVAVIDVKITAAPSTSKSYDCFPLNCLSYDQRPFLFRSAWRPSPPHLWQLVPSASIVLAIIMVSALIVS